MTRQFLQFGSVGALGFIVDASVLWILSHWLPYEVARALSFWAAVTSNWWFNRIFTFKEARRDERAHHQWGRFFCASLIGFIPNWGLFVLLMEWGSQLSISNWPIYPYAALIPGILAGMIINFSLSKIWVFKA
ncbi:GtrA family protein [Rhodanobacter aciditrophus]|uniref:GtrA family protein n=1 Tax=Rhodanobacter aciditrophus TaxID=1623218 RepID=A0ABW4B8C5_9GAMM